MRSDSVFTFKGHTFAFQTGEATFAYELQHKGEKFAFTERLWLPVSGMVKDVPQELLQWVLDNLLLVLGISYYKLYCPRTIELENIRLSEEEAEFWNTIYTKGLGEFFYQNKIDFRDLVQFPYVEKIAAAIGCPRQDRSLLGIGGGKDSIVAGELLKEHGKQFTALVVNSHPIKDEVIALLGVSSLIVRREIDPLLLELNKREDSYNGHVPFSGILAFVGLLTALLYDYRYIVVGNEQSANYGNVEYLGTVVNHQWSKSLEFEELFQRYMQRFITPDVSYFSLLRPLTELGITQRFVQYSKYFPVFSSCNRNFRMSGGTKRWCGACAKCAFAFILLAAFLPKETVVGILGEDLLAKENLLQTYQELLGVRAIKPFDCVGTPEEVKAAFVLAKELGGYDGDVTMEFFEKHVLPKVEDVENMRQEVMSVGKSGIIPEEFNQVVSD
jgi:hypothetical protein